MVGCECEEFLWEELIGGGDGDGVEVARGGGVVDGGEEEGD